MWLFCSSMEPVVASFGFLWNDNAAIILSHSARWLWAWRTEAHMYWKWWRLEKKKTYHLHTFMACQLLKYVRENEFATLWAEAATENFSDWFFHQRLKTPVLCLCMRVGLSSSTTHTVAAEMSQQREWTQVKKMVLLGLTTPMLVTVSAIKPLRRKCTKIVVTPVQEACALFTVQSYVDILPSMTAVF